MANEAEVAFPGHTTIRWLTHKVPNGVLVFAVEGIYKGGKLAFQERGSA